MDISNSETKNPETEYIPTLSSEQQQVFNKYINKENIFITGPGGTGKTHLIKEIVNHATKTDRKLQVCALTGCAAILLMCSASTLHAFAGIGLATGSIEQVVDKVLKNRYKRQNWKKIDLLIVDEVSMLSLKIFKILDMIGRKIKKKLNIPFGGIQLIFSGDFYQLPPVGDEDDPQSVQFCFETSLWDETFAPETNQLVLTKIHRQTEPKYIKILNNIRVGKITTSTITTLTECTKKTYLNDETRPTILLPRRRDADKINYNELNKLDERTEKTYNTTQVLEVDISLTAKENQNLALFTHQEKEHEINYLRENIMAEKQIKLRIGTVVMCIANLNLEGPRPIVNGSQGIIIEYVDNYPKVKFNNGIIKVIEPHVWSSEKVAGIAIKQLPLIYAWAITIHKAQGLSLDTALIDIGNQIFECGQTYVALSRVKSLEGLYLKGFDYKKIRINKKVNEFYINLH